MCRTCPDCGSECTCQPGVDRARPRGHGCDVCGGYHHATECPELLDELLNEEPDLWWKVRETYS